MCVLRCAITGCNEVKRPELQVFDFFGRKAGKLGDSLD